jgi:hypothetical protein
MNNFNYVENHAGLVESRSNLLGMFNLFQDGTALFFGVVQNYEYLSEGFEIREDVVIPVGPHKFNMLVTFLESDKTKRISTRTEINYGQFYNGRIFGLNSTGFLKFTSRLNMEFIFNRNQFNLPVEGGKFAVNIAASRIVYTFTPDLFAKAYIQWNSDDKLFKGNFLVRWIYKPGANVYFIYNETRELGAEGFVKDRLLMLKVSFLFNY